MKKLTPALLATALAATAAMPQSNRSQPAFRVGSPPKRTVPVKRNESQEQERRRKQIARGVIPASPARPVAGPPHG